MPLIHNRGFAKTNTEMPIIFHQSKINLNLTAKSIRSGLSLRIFDVLGCEGFLITNYQAELPEHFNIGEDLEAYTSLDDLIGKCEYYLSHDKDRQEIAHNGLKRLKSTILMISGLLRCWRLRLGLNNITAAGFV